MPQHGLLNVPEFAKLRGFMRGTPRAEETHDECYTDGSHLSLPNDLAFTRGR